MELQFFAGRIGVKNYRRLYWAIVVATNEDNETSTTAAIGIKGAAQYYDVLQDKLYGILNVGRCTTNVLKACMSKTKSGYKFEAKAGDECIEISFEEFERAYANKVFSAATDRKAQYYS